MPFSDLNKAHKCLADFDFARLFIEELGWSQPASRQPVAMTHKDATFTRRQVAQLPGQRPVLGAIALAGAMPAS